ncbi:hypothetical protein [Variovorax sp. UMC13]|uniref:hypothetical protein n=1 Tax=Variovorax sp. UMC13 TaxID=1862326 RepID=UPI001604A126|nr:hypothetical protein [Variovorax sp. UMC13]
MRFQRGKNAAPAGFRNLFRSFALPVLSGYFRAPRSFLFQYVQELANRRIGFFWPFSVHLQSSPGVAQIR